MHVTRFRLNNQTNCLSKNRREACRTTESCDSRYALIPKRICIYSFYNISPLLHLGKVATRLSVGSEVKDRLVLCVHIAKAERVYLLIDIEARKR